ncbi:TolC family protein [bacterium]|nr:TolC family protein [bacterium]
MSVCYAQSDTTTLTYRAYVDNILKYHPLAKQANLRIDVGEAGLRAARGNFDPIVSSGWNQKDFDDKLYYRQFQNTLRIPTWMGVDVVAGYENTEGIFLNPENSTDEFGLWNAGIEVNLLQGLLIDERRTALKQAKIFQNIAENQQQILLNELLYISSIAYLDWQKNYSTRVVIEENIDIATTYFENTKLSFFNGEKTAIDTLEALLILQDATALLQANESMLIKSRQNLENFLWFNDLPLELQPATTPEDYESPVFFIDPVRDNNNTIINGHPMILEKQNKQISYEIDLRLKKEKLKPKLKAKYNPLLATSENNIAPIYTSSNVKWGFDFSFPLFFRSERANVQVGNIKIQEVSLEIENKRNELRNKIEGSLQQQSILRQQLTLMRQNVDGYKQLLDAENEKFQYGESSVFLLNKRQEKYINGRLKLIELNIKFQMELLNYLYHANDLIQN